MGKGIKIRAGERKEINVRKKVSELKYGGEITVEDSGRV